MKSSASDKSAIIDGAQSLKLTDGSATTFNVDDASLLLGKSVAMPNGYKVADIASKIQGEVTSASDLGVLSAAKGVAVTEGGALTLSVAEYNAITSSSRPLNATHKIADTAAAIEAAVGTGTALSGASSIDVQSGVVDLAWANSVHLARNSLTRVIFQLRAAKSFNTPTGIDLSGVKSIEIVAASDYTDLTNAIQNSGADKVDLNGVANVRVSVDQAKVVQFEGSGSFGIKDDATKIIGLSNDANNSSLLSEAQTVLAINTTFAEAVILTETGGLEHKQGVDLAIDLDAAAETKAKTGFLSVAEAKAYVLTNDINAFAQIGYRIEDTYQNINAEKGSDLLSNTKGLSQNPVMT